ncbi:MAG: putative lipid II flippase FtsW [Candidatus Nealsonbacteria bacterium]|nr:putative lipid II flippase FtsW [Candidatus Nealsonbacteria bacterium]
MVLEKKCGQPDYWLLGTIVALLGFGLVILASCSAPLSYEKFGNTFSFLQHQIIFGLIPGLVLAFFFYKIKISLLKKKALFFLLGAMILIMMVFIPGIGLKVEGAARWLSLGPVTFQPSEILKLAFIIYLAAWLTSKVPSQNKGEKKFSQTFFVFLIIFGFIALALALQPDMGTLVVIFVVVAIMYFSANTPLFQTVFTVILAAAAFSVMAKIAPYRANRILVFFNPEIDPMGIGYQLKQSLIAVGSGGLSGAGLGMGVQKFGFLPQPFSDSVFAVFSEEMGFLGAFVLLLLFLIFLWRGFKIAKGAKDRFSQLLAVGITSWVVFQAFVNMGAMIGLLPLTGIPLPFISYGGSSLVMILASLGILLNISKTT